MQKISISPETVFTAPDGKEYKWDGSAFVLAKPASKSRWTGETKFVNPVPGENLGYNIAQNCVTVQEYAEFVKDGGPVPGNWEAQLKLPLRPVVEVSWFDAKAYAKWLSRKTGKEFDLPTEAEWYLAAAGFEKRKYAWGNEEPTPERANYYGDGRRELLDVGSLPGGDTPFGVWDMSGGVYEWCGGGDGK